MKIVYSLPNCPGCVQLKAKLKLEGTEFVERIIGVDIDKPESVEEFREDLRFGRKLRKMSDHGSFVIVAGLVGGMLFALWHGVKASVGMKS